jgi:hypothetical protein
MHCPQCGLQQVSGEVRFCRGCGFSLENIKELLVTDARDVKADKLHTRRINTAFNQGLMLMVISLVLSIVFKLLNELNLVPQVYVKVVAAIFLLGGLVRMFYPYIFSKDGTREEKSISSRRSETKVETARLPFSLPASHSIPVTDFTARRVDTAEMVQPPSVTEHTTKRLNDPRD